MTEEQTEIRQRFAHRLMSPLTVILGSLEMILDHPQELPDYAGELLELAQEQGHRLQEALQDLLSTAQVIGTKIEVSWVDEQAIAGDDLEDGNL